MASLAEQVQNGTVTLIWRAVYDKRTCPDCEERHGVGGLTMDEWAASGLPGTGHTSCGGNCRCTMLPEDLLSVDADILEPFEIKPALDAVPSVDDPIDAARIAGNIRLMEDFRPGGRARYEGPIRQLRGDVGTIRPGVSPDGGLVLDFDAPDYRFPEFASVHVWDFTELISVGD